MRSNKMFHILIILLLSGLFISSNAQVKITDVADLTVNANSLLELESVNRGLLIPRMAINNLNQADPLTVPVPTGMLVFSTGGSVPDGFYYWNGIMWICFSVSEIPLTKSTTDTLLKAETFVLASGDITLTLPVVTAADNGLAITVKNIGSYFDLISVIGNSGATIDGYSDAIHTRWQSRTYVAWNGNWIVKEKQNRTDNLLEVSDKGSFTTIPEVLGFLAAHMSAPVVVRISTQVNLITATQVINLPFPVTFEGASYGSVTLGPSAGLGGSPMFNCITECYFKMIIFDAGMLGGYGSSTGEDAIHLTGSGTYHEIKDCVFDGFYNAVADLSDAELWLFECDITNSRNNGILLNSSVPGAVVKVSETDFSDNVRGVNLLAGSNTTVTLNLGFYSNQNVTDIAILYNPSTFSFLNLIITGNSWNFIGNGIVGFDFTRSDGRDANAFIESNAGIEDKKPHCKINVVNNALTTSCITAGNWYKANWTNTSTITTNLLINNNKITYQSQKTRDIYIIVSGNISVNNINRTITIGMVKNGVTTTRYGESALRITTANEPFQFSTVIYLEGVMQNDYFEMYCSSVNNNDVLIFQDINWFVSAQ